MRSLQVIFNFLHVNDLLIAKHYKWPNYTQL